MLEADDDNFSTSAETMLCLINDAILGYDQGQNQCFRDQIQILRELQLQLNFKSTEAGETTEVDGVEVAITEVGEATAVEVTSLEDLYI